jgi:sulfite reductase alpha subunit-like flavoprotein
MLRKQCASHAHSVFAADDFGVDDLAVEPTVLFVVSTAGQGEFPMNCKEFWKGLQASTEALNSTRYALGPGPRPCIAVCVRARWARLTNRLYTT